MRTVLVSGASGIVGYGILRSLRSYGTALRLIGTSIHGDSAAPAFCDVFELAPPTTDDGYVEWLCDTVRRQRVDLLIPSIECDVYAWDEHRRAIEEAGGRMVLNHADLIRLCRDKWNFHEALLQHHPALAIPTRLEGTFEELAAEFALPFLLKPRRGYASRGIVRVKDKEAYEQRRKDLGKLLMAQPVVGTEEEEYTCSAFFDHTSGLCCHMSLRRRLSPEGFTQSAEVADLEGFSSILASLGTAFGAVGPTNFQFRVHEGGLRLLEINPRISSATSIRTAFGYNESGMCIDLFLENTRPNQPEIRRGRAVRYTDEVIFYDRDHL